MPIAAYVIILTGLFFMLMICSMARPEANKLTKLLNKTPEWLQLLMCFISIVCHVILFTS